MSTITFWAADLDAARRWYVELLGLEPYFERPGYLEFRLGDLQTELGIIDARYAPEGSGTGPAGAVVYWAVDDVQASLARLLELGARVHQPLREFGPGFVGASVVDPFGNVLAVMHNEHYLQVVAGRAAT